jgi:phosphate:Na+ symporter
LQFFGGLGVFLLGMIIMTDGLRTLAGDSVRKLLKRFTRNPASGALTGAVATAILQSSSTTTVVAVGFVGAGILTFGESIGIIFGANIGTTLKGWLFVLLGFKLNIANILLPIIFVGVLIKMFARTRVAEAGMVLAGFGLIFLGLAMMQNGMEGLQGVVTPSVFPDDTWTGRIQLFLIGLVITLVTQSSSAGVAAALTALFAGAINFEQAAAMVIGMDVGTTATTLIATIGGSVGSRRTGLSHVFYNVITGIGAMLFLTPYILLWEYFAPGKLHENPELGLVAFHTAFNALGVLIMLPFTEKFAGIIRRLVPDHNSVYTSGLDDSLLNDPVVSITALSGAVDRQMRDLFLHASHLLGNQESGKYCNLTEMRQALEKSKEFAEQIKFGNDHVLAKERLISLMHALDHLQRLVVRCDRDAARAERAAEMPELKTAREKLSAVIKLIQTGSDDDLSAMVAASAEVASEIVAQAQQWRSDFMHEVADGLLSVPDANRKLEAVRWLQRVSDHIARVCNHVLSAAETV